MPRPTYDLIATTTLAASASSITFSSIPATYRDLIVVINATATAANDLFMTFNSDSSNYNMVRMGAVTAAAAQTQSTREVGLQRTGLSTHILQIMDYSATDKHKTTLSRTNGSGDFVAAYASRYASTSVISTIVFTIADGSSFTSNSSFSLYGVIA
jgi:hypothetical protein